MIRIFYGDDRVKAREAIDRQLGKEYEVIEAENLTKEDLPSVFLGTSLFGETRSILIKNLSDNKDCWAVVPNYIADCTHSIIIWENKLDKRSVTYKELAKNKNIEFKEFKLAETFDKNAVFGVFDAAFRGDSKEALKLCETIELTNDPYMFMGLMTTQAIKKMQYNNSKAPRVLKILAKADMDMKTTGLDPWVIIKTALLKISKQ